MLQFLVRLARDAAIRFALNLLPFYVLNFDPTAIATYASSNYSSLPSLLDYLTSFVAQVLTALR